MTARGRIRAGLALALAIGLGTALGACSSGGPTLFQRVGTAAQAIVVGPEETGPARQPTRAELNQIPSAVIAVSTGGGPRAFLVPLTDNGGYLNYRDEGGNAVVLFGGAVSGTASLGYDLQAVRHHRLDPIAHPTPLGEWPDWVPREYQYTLRDLGRYSITLDCVYDRLVRETIEIVEVSYQVVRVSETCTNARRQFTNTYWLEEGTGFIWKSEQWIGPQLGHMTVEIIRPYEG